MYNENIVKESPYSENDIDIRIFQVFKLKPFQRNWSKQW